MKVFLVTLCLVFVNQAFGDTDVSDAFLEQEFKKEDKDNSGGLSLDEVKAATVEDSNGQAIPPDVLKAIEAGFKEDDTNHDGVLSFAEVKAKVEKNKKMAEAAPDS
ncbi:unnamed protein product [Enterobius vermicularis]|uniref:EF-hand domain-containing protein n=1 Tax=Enterobius vermicularis TaxID=51028 RepID=A0A0N4V5D2_ENTVE|nr:unnamed protein product [Enterobius vermicularis]